MTKDSADKTISCSLILFAFSLLFSVTAVQGAMLLALLAWALSRGSSVLADLKKEIPAQPLFKPWMFFLGACLLAAIAAYYPAQGLSGFKSDFNRYLCFATLILLVRKKHLPALDTAFTSAAALAALIGVFQSGTSLLTGEAQIQRAGAFMNPIRYAMLMEIALTLSLARLVFCDALSRRAKLFYGFTAIVCTAAIALSQTRGAYLGAAATIIALIYFSDARRLRAAALATALLASGAAITLLTPGMKERLAAMIDRTPAEYAADSHSTAINIRLDLWELGIEMIRANPLTGVGPDNIRKVFKTYHPEPIAHAEVWGNLHNLYLHQAAERGLIGLAALLTLFISMFRLALKNLRVRPGPHTLWAAAALPAYFVMNLTESSFQQVHTSYAIILALAFSAAAARAEDQG